MYLIPFGEVEQERYAISKRYGLIEMVGGIWRLTEKCKKNYNCDSYFYYLQGKVDKPTRIEPTRVNMQEQKTAPKTTRQATPVAQRKLTPQEEMRTPEYQQLVDELLAM